MLFYEFMQTLFTAVFGYFADMLVGVIAQGLNGLLGLEKPE